MNLIHQNQKPNVDTRLESEFHITKTCPCNIQRIFFSVQKNENFHQKSFDIFSYFPLKT